MDTSPIPHVKQFLGGLAPNQGNTLGRPFSLRLRLPPPPHPPWMKLAFVSVPSEGSFLGTLRSRLYLSKSELVDQWSDYTGYKV